MQGRARILQASSGTFLAVCGVVIAGALATSLDAPWRYAALAIAVICALWALVGTSAVARWFNSAAPDQAALPTQPEPGERIGWGVTDNAVEVEGVAFRTEHRLVQKLKEWQPRELTEREIAHILTESYHLQPPRISRDHVRRLCSPVNRRRYTRPQVEEFISLCQHANIIRGRKAGFAGYLVGDLQTALGLFGLADDLAVAGSPWPRLASPGTVAVVGRISVPDGGGEGPLVDLERLAPRRETRIESSSARPAADEFPVTQPRYRWYDLRTWRRCGCRGAHWVAMNGRWRWHCPRRCVDARLGAVVPAPGRGS